MYKAIHRQTAEEIIILSPKWSQRIRELRAMDGDDLLICQGCQQAVRVRAGKFRRPHFAHKHLMGCSYGTESVEILEARAILYQWLLRKFPDEVSVEKKLEGVDLPRPVDCWVETQGRQFAYWIIDSTLKLPAREKIKVGIAERGGLSVHWVFLSKMLRLNLHNRNFILLSPTERDFLKHSQFDVMGDKRRPVLTRSKNQPVELEEGSSIHYLDIKTETLTSFRSLRLYHAPNVFDMYKLETPLALVQVSLENGEFIHPGENTQLKLSQKKQALQEQERKQKQERYRQWQEKRRSPAAVGWNLATAPKAIEEATCIFCGKATSNWWTTWVEDGVKKCKCRDCYAKGLA